MIDSIIEDIRNQFRIGNRITQIILINIMIWVVINIFGAFSPGGINGSFFSNIFSFIALPSTFSELVFKPWTLLSHMFVHKGLWHIIWNMLLLYWMGRIFGDLLGDRRVLPLYIASGLAGAFFYLILSPLVFPGHSIAFGASAAVMGITIAAAMTAPEYNMRLVILGDVKLKYIAVFLVIIDIVMIGQRDNVGGHIGHIGGALFGALYVYLLQHGKDILEFSKFQFFQADAPPARPKMTVVHRKPSRPQPSKRNTQSTSLQEEVDRILDKINEQGYNSLTPEEKDILYRASKN